MKRLRPELIPVLVTGFLAPIIGGQVSLEALPSEGNFIASIFGAPESPFATRALLGTLICFSLLVYLLKSKVIQIPNLQIFGLGLGFIALIGLSVFSSSFGYVSYGALISWLIFGLAVLAVVATVGRKLGVRALCWSMILGGTIAALKGISEYASIRGIEPGHRIFGDWNNPNAFAGVLCLLIPLAFGLGVSSERLERLGALASASLMSFALVLTQSKGGILCLAIAILVFIATAAFLGARKQLMSVALSIVVAGVLVFGSTAANKQSSNGGSLERLTNVTTSQEQSAGFRTLLWKGCIQLVREKPLGIGIGAYRFDSAKPGLTDQTFHAHQEGLQLAVEASPLAPLLLIAISLLWFKNMLKGAKSFPKEISFLKSGILASFIAASLNGFMESNLVYLGIGICLAFIFGCGIQCSGDGSAPEAAPKEIRRLIAIIACIVPLVMLWHTATVESLKSSALSKAATKEFDSSKADLVLAKQIAPNDGESYFLLSRFSAGDERTVLLNQASTLFPSTKYLRAYAQSALQTNRPKEANRALDLALQRDPGNLQTLAQYYIYFDKLGQKSSALEWARKLLAAEDSSSFKTRAIPELVPLETYDARLFLAKNSTSPEEKFKLLKDAISGYALYMQRTAPMIKRMTNGDPNLSFLGHDMAEIEEVRIKASESISQLKGLSPEINDPEFENWVQGIEAIFASG